MRINHVAKARKSKKHRACHTCHQPIDAGQAYSWVQASMYSPRISWHSTCSAPAASALEPNEKRSAAMEAFETAYAALDDLRASDDEVVPEDLVAAVTEIVEQCGTSLNEAAELWRESAQSIEEGFGHPTSQSEEFEGNADEVDGVADEVSSIEGDEYDEEQFTDVAEWASGYLDSIVEQLGDAEGNLP